MTPDQAHRLQDLFYEARKTTRATEFHPLTPQDRRGAYEADDAAVEAFMDAVAEMARPDEATERLRMLTEWAEAMIEESNSPQYGRDVKTLIEAPIEALREAAHD